MVQFEIRRCENKIGKFEPGKWNSQCVQRIDNLNSGRRKFGRVRIVKSDVRYCQGH